MKRFYTLLVSIRPNEQSIVGMSKFQLLRFTPVPFFVSSLLHIVPDTILIYAIYISR